MWIVNKYGWIGNGNIDQCICINIREGGNASNPNPIYPINYNWVDNLGSDSIGIWNLECTIGCKLGTKLGTAPEPGRHKFRQFPKLRGEVNILRNIPKKSIESRPCRSSSRERLSAWSG